MKTFFVIGLLLTMTNVFSQTIYDKKVKKEYKSLLKTIPGDFTNLRSIPNPDSSILFITDWVSDTLNKDELIQEREVIGLVNPLQAKENKKSVESKPKAIYKYVRAQPFHSSYSGDTLIIFTRSDVDDGEEVILKLVDDRVVATYRYLALLATTWKIERLIDVKAAVLKIELNEKPIKPGQTFYGAATIKTDEVNWGSSDFRKGFRRTRFTISFLFSSILK